MFGHGQFFEIQRFCAQSLMDPMQVALMNASRFNAEGFQNAGMMEVSTLYMENVGAYVINKKVVQFLITLIHQFRGLQAEMERIEGEVGEELDVHMFRIARELDFLIALISCNVEMQLIETRSINELLSH